MNSPVFGWKWRALRWLKVAWGIAAIALFVGLILFALDTDRNAGSRAVAAVWALALVVRDAVDRAQQQHTDMMARLNALEEQIRRLRAESARPPT